MEEAETQNEDNKSEYRGSALCHPSHSCHRYFFLIFMCFLGSGNYFCYDAPGALELQIISEMDSVVDTSYLAGLYSVYYFSNVIFSLCGGYIISKYIGINWGAIIFCCFTFVGQIILGFGAFTDKYWLMLVGRMIYAVGGENLVVTTNMRAVKWFNGKELTLVFGLQASVNHAASTLVFIVMEPLYNSIRPMVSTGYKCLGIVFIIASALTAFDLLLAIILAIRDYRAERILKIESDSDVPQIKFSDVLHFKADYWSLCFIIIFYYIGIFPFVSLGVPFYKRKYGFNDNEANVIDGIIYSLAIVISPFIGGLIGQIGRNTSFILVAVIISWISHSLMAFTTLNPWFLITLMSFGYSIIVCTIWAMISNVVPEHQLGTSYGVAQAIENLFLGITVYFVGWLVDNQGYFVLEIFFILSMSISIIFVMILMVYDDNNGGFLNMSPKQRLKEIENLTKHDESISIVIPLSKHSDLHGIDGIYKTTAIEMREISDKYSNKSSKSKSSKNSSKSKSQ